MMKMMNCFCGMVDRRKALSLISSRDHCQRFSPSRISDTPRARFEPAQNQKLCSSDNHYTTAPLNEVVQSALIQNDKFELPDGYCTISDIQDYFEYIIKKHETMTNNSPIEIFICEIKKIITFKIKTACYLEILISETMKFIRSTENKITKDKNEENVPHLEITEVILVSFNFVNNDDQQDSRVLYTFVPYRLFDQLLEISQTNFIFLTTYDSQFSYIEV